MNVRHYLVNRRRHTREPLHLKLRVVVQHPMRASTARRLLQRAIDTGRVPAGIEIRWMDWSKGDEGRARSGRIMSRQVRGALREFATAMFRGRQRFAKVR